MFLLLTLATFICMAECWIGGYANQSNSIYTIERVTPVMLSCQELDSIMNTQNLDCNTIHIQTTRFYKIDSTSVVFYLQVTQFTQEFLAPNFQVEKRFGDMYIETDWGNTDTHCYYDGKVIGNDYSHVVLSTCEGGLEGIIKTSTGDYLLTTHYKNDTTLMMESQLHTQKSSLNNRYKEKQCGRHSDTQIHRRYEKISHEYQFKFTTDGSLYALQPARYRRAISVQRYIETMVVADESMFEYYGRKEIELRRYLLSVMAMVTSIMKDNSVGNFIEVSVIKLVILKKNPHNLEVTNQASQSLKRFCKWQKRQNKVNDTHPEHYDAAVLITRKNMCSATGKCDTLGLAELGSVCDPVRSCAIVEDNGLSVAFTIAHELGHLINAPHDGENNECTESAGKVNIMTPTFSVNLNTWSWSKCSRRSITNFLESSEASCLLDKPSPKFEHPLPLKLPGEMFLRDEQCQLIYGKSSVACPFVTQCDRIWCIREYFGRRSCHTNNMPWADGTKCGESSWCIHGQCHPKKSIKPINGNWGLWGPFSNCSRPCGGGIKYATRKCDSPMPSYGGNYCVGHRHQYKSCNIHKCTNNKITFRAEQCKAFNGKDLGIPGVPSTTSWLPKLSGVHENDVCKLFCEVQGYGIFYELAPKVIDGTKCRKGSNDICVDGKCRLAGCDNILNSNAKLDNCGVCKGDNSTCRTYIGYKNSTHLGYNFVVHVPKGANQLKVVQLSAITGKHDTNFLALVDAKKRYVFNGRWRVSLGKRRYVTHGTTVYYSGPNEVDEAISVPGLVKNNLEIRVLSIAPSFKVNIKYSYKYPVNGTQKYRWKMQDNWSGCFPICQGYQIKEYECQRDIDSQIVHESKCAGSKPPTKHRMCNLDCNLRWDAFKDECIAFNSCGNGFRKQKVVCKLLRNTTTRVIEKILTHTDCHKAKIGKMPKREARCYTPCTRVRWIYSAWTTCNKICGKGIQTRQASCVDQESNTTQLMTKCSKYPKEPLTRPCNTNPCPKWHTGAWAGVCSVTCGDGFVERLVTCVAAGKTVTEQKCDTEKKPDQTRPCILSACATWKERAWGKCSEPCGWGHQVREIYCETETGEKVDDTKCNNDDKSIDRRKCFEKACELKAQIIFNNLTKPSTLHNVRWLTGVWDQCSTSCGGGIRERVVACVADNVIVDDTQCQGSDKPMTKELCNVYSCPFWRHGAWSKCTKNCGKGTQTRLVLCGYNGTIVGDEWCKGTVKSQHRRFCNVKKCHSSGLSPFYDDPQQTEDWEIGPWTECSVSCGLGYNRRTVHCVANECKEYTKPREQVTCNNGPCPGWNYGQWTPCYTDSGCGEGWQARLVVCQTDEGKILHDSVCSVDQKPTSNRTCQTQPCKQNVKWSPTPWQPCNVPCDNGTQYRYIACEDENGNQVSEEKCLKYEARPSQERACSRESCAIWFTTDWEQCDSNCYHHRVVECRRRGELIDENNCKLDDKPISEKECSNENCVKEPVFQWKVGKWTLCGKSCGYSLKTRSVDCIDELERIVDASNCLIVKPAVSEQCFEGLCPPEWIAQPWIECSMTCGEGLKTRDVKCFSENREVLDDSACVLRDKPSSSEKCLLGQCGDRYRWIADAWTQCTKSCGVGETTRTVVCVNDQNVTQPMEMCAVEHILPTSKVCNTHTCPFQSCRDIQKKLAVKFDGEQILHFGNLTLSVYCEGMHRSNPKEYITLQTDANENYAEIYGKRLKDSSQCPNNGRRQIPCTTDCIDYTASGVTFFKKVRLDVKRLTIVPEDKTFADRFGRNPPGFASAGDCYSGVKCPQGRFMVNLTGTGLRVAENVQWTTRGYHTSQKIRRHKNGQVIYGKCGGYCGMCSPSGYNGLKLEIYANTTR